MNKKIHFLVLAFIIVIGIFLRLYYVNQPMRLDEAATFNTYLDKSFARATSDYSYPNNHLLHTALIFATTHLFGQNHASMRLPALISGIGIILATYMVARKFFGNEAALLAAAFISVASYQIGFSTNARGYTMLTFGALLMIWSAQRIIYNNDRWFLFSLVTFLTFLTMPTTLYIYAGVLLWIVGKIVVKKDLIKSERLRWFHRIFLYCIFLPGLLTLFGYLPTLIYSGGPASLNPSLFKEQESFLRTLQTVPNFLGNVVKLWHRDQGVFLSSILAAVAAAGFFILLYALGLGKSNARYPNLYKWARSSQDGFALVVIIFASTIIISLAQRITPYERSLIFLEPLYFMILGLIIYQGINKFFVKISKPIYNSLIILLLIYTSFNILSSKSILRSTETGAFPDGEVIVKFLRTSENTSDLRLVLAETPSKEILYFYMKKYGLNPLMLENFYSPRLPPHTFAVVDYAVNLDLRDYLRQADPSAKLLAKFENSEVWKFSYPEEYRKKKIMQWY